MKDNVLKKATAYKNINDIALKGEIVIYGSTYMANFPFYELANKSRLENAIYNRSIEGLTIDEALTLLKICVLDISPSKVFINLGEEDFAEPDSIKKYKTIVETIRNKLPYTKIYLICVQSKSEKALAFNKSILDLCDNKKVFCIKFSTTALSGITQYKTIFKELCCFFRSKPISFTKAFAISSL